MYHNRKLQHGLKLEHGLEPALLVPWIPGFPLVNQQGPGGAVIVTKYKPENQDCYMKLYRQ